MEQINFLLLKMDHIEIRLFHIIIAILVVFGTSIFLKIIKKSMMRSTVFAGLDKGSAYALYQILKYFIWVAVISLLLNMIGFDLTLLIAGSAALLVGLGFGMQQTFNDFISGFIILAEGIIKVGDVMEVDDEILIIEHIGLRTSKGRNREDVIVIIPNSLITNEKVINYSHKSPNSRFNVEVGVAYGSDLALVESLLLEAAVEQPEITDLESIETNLLNFGASALEYEVDFVSHNAFDADVLQSKIRKSIYKKFSDNGIVIAFPQMDVHISKQE